MRCARYVTLINSQFKSSGELFARTLMYAHLINYVLADRLCVMLRWTRFLQTTTSMCSSGRRRVAYRELSANREERQWLVTDSPAMFSRARDTCNLFRAARDETHLASDLASSLRMR